MDFFQQQDVAKRNTFWLLFFFAMAVLGIVISVYLLISAVLVYNAGGGVEFWNPELFVTVFIFTFVVVGIGSFYKMVQLSEGGAAVAESLGGRRIDHSTKDFNEQKLLNIVEEIAVATGIPTPAVYVLDNEPAINAFAAGWTVDAACITVTRGTLDNLSREELQGVVAHEYSHIVNGDMRINIRLMGILFGILALGIIGYYVMRSAIYMPGGRSSDERQSGGVRLVALLVGLGLMVLGTMGTFFGQLIKAAVSRQREFLADAAAVQFTRNPDGIGGALIKIRDSSSAVLNPKAAEVSHMFFAKGVLSGLASLFETHPPIEERIRRILPSGEVGTASTTVQPQPRKAPQLSSKQRAASFVTSASILETLGQPSVDHIAYAKMLIEELPKSIVAAIHDTFGARAVMLGLLLSHDAIIRKMQLDFLAKGTYRGVYQELERLIPDIEKIPVESCIPLVDMAMPALAMLSKQQYEVFRTNIESLIKSDKTIHLFEWTLEKILLLHLDTRFRPISRPLGKEQLSRYPKEAEYLMQVLGFAGAKDPNVQRASFQEGMKHLNMVPLRSTALKEVDFTHLDHILTLFNNLLPQDKKRLLEAALFCIQADKQVNLAEAELFRTIADAIGCPVPLILVTKCDLSVKS